MLLGIASTVVARAAVAPGPPRRAPHAAADPDPLAHLHRRRRDRRPVVPDLARDRRELQRRRLHLGYGLVADHAGYMSNYFRWFGSPEDPFGWFYNLLALMTHVSDASIWMRLPT